MNYKLTHNLKQLLNSNKLPWIIILIGIVLRLIRYLHNPSIYFDEANISIDIIRTPLSEIILPSSDYDKAYPFLFVAGVKMLTMLLGTSEYVLRFLPLLSGIASVFLFYKVAKHYIEPNAVTIALGLFAILESLIFQSSDLKPYSGDILCTLLIYVLAINIQSRYFNVPSTILFGISGAVIVWFSNPAVFVLAGAGLYLLYDRYRAKKWKEAGKLCVSYLIWIVSFTANFFFYLRPLQANFGKKLDEMLRVMENAYMPIPPTSLGDIKWYYDLFFGIFDYPLSMTLAGIAAFAFLSGCFAIYIRSRKDFSILMAPILITFLAGALHQYPFRSRFIIFLLPVMLFFIAEGAEYIRSRTAQSSRVIGVLFIALLFFHPFMNAANRTIKPLIYEELPPVLEYVKTNWHEGDFIYVHYFAQYSFEYYTQFHPSPVTFNEADYIYGIAPRGWYRHWRKKHVSQYYGPEVPVEQSSQEVFDFYARDLDQLRGKKRVWLIFTSNIVKDGISEEKFIIQKMELFGKKLDYIVVSGISSAYLYDLSEQAGTR